MNYSCRVHRSWESELGTCRMRTIKSQSSEQLARRCPGCLPAVSIWCGCTYSPGINGATASGSRHEIGCQVTQSTAICSRGLPNLASSNGDIRHTQGTTKTGNLGSAWLSVWRPLRGSADDCAGSQGVLLDRTRSENQPVYQGIQGIAQR